MAEHHANPDDCPDIHVKLPGPCGCETPSHYIILSWGPLTIKPPEQSVQLEQKTCTRYKAKQEEFNQVPTETCCFSDPPSKHASLPALVVSKAILSAGLPAKIIRPPAPAPVAKIPARIASPPARVPSLPAQIAIQPALVTGRTPPAPQCLSNARPQPLVNPFSVFKPAPEPQSKQPTRRWVDQPELEALLLAGLSPRLPNYCSPPVEPRQLKSSPPKRQRNKTIKKATKLTKQRNVPEESAFLKSAGLQAAAPAAAPVPAAARDAMSARAQIEADNARFAAAIRAQLATPVPLARPRCMSGDDMWRPRHQPKTLAGARLAAALAERRRQKLLIGLKHLGSE